jgi:hypothetical protein
MCSCCMLCVMCNHMLYVMRNHRSFPYVFHSLRVLHCYCISLSSVVASKHYVHFVSFCVCHMYCVMQLSYVLRDVFAICTARLCAIRSPLLALSVIRWQVLSYVCHKQVRPFGFTQM